LSIGVFDVIDYSLTSSVVAINPAVVFPETIKGRTVEKYEARLRMFNKTLKLLYRYNCAKLLQKGDIPFKSTLICA